MSGTSAELATLSRWVSEKSPGYQHSFRPDPGRLGGEARKEEGERCVCVCVLYQLLRISEPRLHARQRSAAAGRQTHPLASGAAYTLSGAHQLIPRLKFTFAPSRLNSHFSSSHNTSLSRDTENDGLPTRPACKYVCWLQFFSFLNIHINTVYASRQE